MINEIRDKLNREGGGEVKGDTCHGSLLVLPVFDNILPGDIGAETIECG